MLVVIAGLVITARSIAADLQVIRTYNSRDIVITLLGPWVTDTVAGGAHTGGHQTPADNVLSPWEGVMT